MISIDELVPEDHLLRKIDKYIDFGFIYDLAEDKYSKDTDHPIYVRDKKHAADDKRDRGEHGIQVVFRA